MTDPTGAARTADLLPTSDWLQEKVAHYVRMCDAASPALRDQARLDYARFCDTRQEQHAATLAHLARQAEDVRGLAERTLATLDELAIRAVEFDSDAFGLPSTVERNTGRAEGVRVATEALRRALRAAPTAGTEGAE